MQYRSHNQTDAYLKVETDRGTIWLLPCSPLLIRCVYTRRTELLPNSFLVEKPETSCRFQVSEEGKALRLSTDALRWTLDKSDCSMTWRLADGTLLHRNPGMELRPVDVVRYRADEERRFKTEKTVDGDRITNQNLVPYTDRTAYRGKLCFSFGEDEALYGLGQAEEGIFNCRGKSQFLYQTNMRIPIPFLISSRKYGLFFDCGSVMAFNDDYHGSSLWFDTVEQLDWYFMAGDSFDALIAEMRGLTGRAAMLPKWAFGYLQSREAYHTQEELVEVAREYRRREIPLDCVVQDWQTWEPGQWGNKVPDRTRYPDIAAAAKELHDMQVHAMVSIWPNMNVGCENHREFAEKGLLLADYATYDPYQEPARELYWKQARPWFDAGFDAWWCDSSEGFCRSDWDGEFLREPWERFLLVSEELKRFLDPALANTFCVLHAKTIYDGQRAATDEKRVVNLTRSGYPSIQKYGAILWSGDISSKWPVLRKQIAEGLRISLSGIPYWTLDAGGFFAAKGGRWFIDGDYPDGVRDPGFCELYVRFLQLACFLPVFRSHGTSTPREIWNFGEEGGLFYDAIAETIRLRYRLIPYLYSLGAKTVLEHYTMLRALVFDFLDDPNTREISDAFMFGPALLVCPVTSPMYYEAGGRAITAEKERTCYLPRGCTWYDFWTGARYEGGQTIRSAAPIDRIPVFVRAGSILPMTQTVQSALQESEMPLELHLYPGADGSFTLYEDSGDGYGYERGEYAETVFTWSDAGATLTIGARQGAYPGMPEKRACLVKCGSYILPFELDGSGQTLRLPVSCTE